MQKKFFFTALACLENAIHQCYWGNMSILRYYIAYLSTSRLFSCNCIVISVIQRRAPIICRETAWSYARFRRSYQFFCNNEKKGVFLNIVVEKIIMNMGNFKQSTIVLAEECAIMEGDRNYYCCDCREVGREFRSNWHSIRRPNLKIRYFLCLCKVKLFAFLLRIVC